MSNMVSGIVGSVMQSNTQKALLGKQLSDEKRREQLATPSVRQSQFATGTLGLLDEARTVAESAVQQGQELNPMIYQMLGLSPTYEDNSGDLASAQKEFDASQSQLDEAQKTLSQLQGIPGRKRTPAQKKQLRQLNKQMPALQKSLENARDTHGRLATMPKRITGFSRLDPSQIPADSPFSQQNPLFQIAHTEAERAQQAMEGGLAVDPTLVHRYTQAEGQLRAQLAARYGPDYENTSIGQMALQNFDRTKSEAFATWNYNKQQEYAKAAFDQQQGLQSLLAGNISLLREPSQTTATEGAQLAQQAGPRLSAQQTWNQYLLGRSGLGMGPVPSVPMPSLGSGSGVARLLDRFAQSGQQPTTVDPAVYQSGTEGGEIAAPGASVSGSNIGTATEASAVDAGA